MDSRLPVEFIERFHKYFPGEAEAFFACQNGPAACGLRANTLKLTAGELKNMLGCAAEPVGWCADGFYYPDGERPAKSPLYHAGLYYIQEPGAMAAAALLDVKPGDKVLDVCAAPGGKATQLLCALNGRGLLIANDARASRIGGLVTNIERHGAKNCVVTNERPERLSERFPNFFDKILVDAPCSGEGTFRKDPSAMKNWGRYKSDECAAVQRHILRHAGKMLKPGGRLAYSTCTFSPEENEFVVEDFLCANAEYSIAPIDRERLGLPREAQPNGFLRMWPHRVRSEGHFVALIEKNIGADDGYESGWDENRAARRGVKPPDSFAAFCAENLLVRFDGPFVLHARSLYFAPPELPGLSGLRVVRRGFYLGEDRGGRFEPSQALAMGLAMSDAKNPLDLSLEDARVSKYLRGESIEADVPDATALVCVAGRPLGWGKSRGGVVKNKYPTNLAVR